MPPWALAGTRPVFRGLRHPGSPCGGQDGQVGDSCRDETRFQGIATVAETAPLNGVLVTACRDETRFQGIATGTGSWRTSKPGSSCRDETRFQGIATRCATRVAGPPPRRSLQGRDPFSGDCDSWGDRAAPPPATPSTCRDETRFQGIATPDGHQRPLPHCAFGGLQGRDPFSGDCDSR